MVRFAFHFCGRSSRARCFFGFVLAVCFVGSTFGVRRFCVLARLGTFFIGSGLGLWLAGGCGLGSGSRFLRSIVHYGGLGNGFGGGGGLCRSGLGCNEQGQQGQAENFQKFHA